MAVTASGVVKASISDRALLPALRSSWPSRLITC